MNSAEVLNDPEALAFMQSKLAGMVGNLSGYYDSLPKSIKRRVKALKKLQVDYLKLESQFHKEMHAVECKYNALYQGLLVKRADIVNASYEPKDEECDFPSDDEDDDEDIKEIDGDDKTGEDGDKEKKLSKDLEEKMKTDEPEDDDEDTKGIPEFWLTIFKNVDLISENIQECDEPILKHLTDIKVKLVENPMSFTLEFYFSSNEFFTDSVLTKTYELKCTPDETDPFSFEGPEISKAIGCKINWNEGKNVTIKTVMKKQKHKAKGSTRTVPKEVQSDSFFNFFAPPEVPENEEDIDETTQEILSADFEIGEIIRHRLVPRAVLYFTGEAMVDDDYDEDDEEDEEEYDSDDDEDDDDDDEDGEGDDNEVKGRKPRKKRGQAKNPEECKQS
ncbi:nucleosome assembly protein 1-like 1-A [Panonychus citri]|uniref:nucleosome assembly protein 1-like 1-A n=1 Tax=Panonychus citri TaxID=50023 RepID=UPI00230727D2|nr:nucleosome assembly protein 1-like 1-A [Panonychus citri]